MTKTKFYAWGIPASLTRQDIPAKLLHNLDHTWITTFPEPVNPDPQPYTPPDMTPPESFWYCWGKAHYLASHEIVNAEGDIDIADAISPANKVPYTNQPPHSTNSGSIEYYGLDGVCHTVANQILCATGTKTREPVRVKGAKGYPLSTFFYGTYGLNTSVWNDICNDYLVDITLPGDDFIPIMNTHVPEDKHKALEDIRKKAKNEFATIRAVAKNNPDYDYIEDMKLNSVARLGDALILLGPSVFEKLFPFTDIHDTDWMLPAGYV